MVELTVFPSVAFRSSERGKGRSGIRGGVIRRGIRVGEEGEGAGSNSASPGGKREPRADKPQTRKT